MFRDLNLTQMQGLTKNRPSAQLFSHKYSKQLRPSLSQRKQQQLFQYQLSKLLPKLSPSQLLLAAEHVYSSLQQLQQQQKMLNHSQKLCPVQLR